MSIIPKIDITFSNFIGMLLFREYHATFIFYKTINSIPEANKINRIKKIFTLNYFGVENYKLYQFIHIKKNKYKSENDPKH